MSTGPPVDGISCKPMARWKETAANVRPASLPAEVNGFSAVKVTSLREARFQSPTPGVQDGTLTVKPDLFSLQVRWAAARVKLTATQTALCFSDT